MKKIIFFLLFFLLLWSCGIFPKTKTIQFEEKKFSKIITDERDQTKYGTVEVGKQIWFAENLKFITPKSICYQKKKENCKNYGRLYPHDELENLCPKDWRVPNIRDWEILKSNFQKDSITALLDTINWKSPVNHTNESGLSIQGAGYQMEKRLFIGDGAGTTLWLNQFNQFDEYYHVHLYGGEGISFEQSNYITNEVFHAHPIEDLKNRRFSVRCVCDKN